MNAQQLKNSILQEAIEGRLVPQNPNDEPASKLLQRIREEKKRLVKEGKLKKKDLEEKPISKDEIPFEIPESWEWVRLGDYASKVTDFVASGSFASLRENVKYYSNKEYAILVRTKDFQTDFQTDLVYTDKHGYKFLSNSNLFGGELILPNIGASIGKVFIVPKLNYRMTLAPNSVMVRFYWDEQRDWIFTLFSSIFGKKLLYTISSSTAQGKFNKTDFKQILIPIPPLAEQQRIVAMIEELLPKVEEYGKAQEALNRLNEELPEKMKKSILQEAIEGRLVPQDPNDEPASVLLDKIRKEKARLVKEGKLKKKDLEEKPISEDEIPFEIPESWEWVRIKTILNVYSARRVHEKDWRTSGIPFYRAREIGKLADFGFVDNELFIEKSLYDEFSKSGVPHGGDLMVTAVGTLGKVYIVKDNDLFYYKDGSVLCMNNFYGLNPQYLKYYIESTAFKNQYQPESQGTTVATLTMVRVNEYIIPLPPLAEQHRIVEKIEQLLGEIDKLKTK